MPKLLDLTKNAAEDEMKAIGLKADFAYEKGSSSDDSDLIVVKQQYKKGESLAVGTKVKLTLGKKEFLEAFLAKSPDPAYVGRPVAIDMYMHRDWDSYIAHGINTVNPNREMY